MADGKVLVVIGGTSGIGREIARRAAETVILSGRDTGHAQQVAAEIGGDTTGIAVDLSGPPGSPGSYPASTGWTTWCLREWPATRTRWGPTTSPPPLPW